MKIRGVRERMWGLKPWGGSGGTESEGEDEHTQGRAQSSKRDYWDKCDETWRRIHEVPRKELFTPMKVEGGRVV